MKGPLFLALAATWCLWSPAQVTAQTPAAADSLVQVTYLAGNLVYVDAGREDGLEEGAQVSVERDGVVVAVLRLEHIASHCASCTVVDGDGTPQIGDVIRFQRVSVSAKTEPPTGAPIASKPRAATGPGGLAGLGFRGRVGARYLTVMDQGESSAGFSQPALDLRLTGNRLNGGPVSVHVDARARRTYRTRSDGESSHDGRTRVYRLGASYQAPGSRFRVSVGRQVSPDLASVSLFDGALTAYEPGRWSLGVFAGTQPDPVTWGPDTEIIEAGGYTRYRNADGAASRWAVTGGAVASRQNGAVNRDYLFFRGQLLTGRIFGYLAQEVDINRGWKAGAGEPALTATSTYASLRYRISGALDVDAGYDNRRKVRLYRDRDTPETEFDDSYRRGVRAGVTIRPIERLRLSLSGRSYSGGTSDTESATLTTRLLRLTRLNLGVGTRHTRYTGPLSEGWLHVASADVSLGRRRRLGVHVGRRDEDRFTGAQTTANATWVGADLDFGLAGGWHALFSVESTRGDVEKNDQVYSSLTYRF